MNKVILMGRLTRNPDIRYSQGEKATCVARYTLAVNRRFKRDGEPDADFIGCVAFGKSAEFAERYYRKGIKIIVAGRIQTGSYINRDGQRVYTTDVVVEEQEFAESKSARQQNDSAGYPDERDDYSGNGGRRAEPWNAKGQSEEQRNRPSYQQQSFETDRNGFMKVSDEIDEELPFH